MVLFFIMLTEFVVLLGEGKGGSPLFGVGGYVLLNRVWFSGSSVIYNFTIIVTGAKQNTRKLLFTVLVRNSEPIRLFESPRSLSVNMDIYQLFWTQACPEGMCTNRTQVLCEVPFLPNPTTCKGLLNILKMKKLFECRGPRNT